MFLNINTTALNDRLLFW